MNGIDSDLEEGEIIDDIPSFENSAQNKKLPRRYDIDRIKNSHSKHKKKCRHTIRHHIKKLAKLKQSPVMTKPMYKNDNQSNILVKNHQNNLFVQTPLSKKANSKNASYNTFNNGTREDNSNNRSNAVLVAENMHVKSERTENVVDSNKLSKIREKYRALKNRKNIVKARFNNDLPFDNFKASDQTHIHSNGSKSPEVIVISDDEEDLRQIALATCAKQNAHVETFQTLNQSNCNNVPEVIETNPSFSNYDNCIADNHDVVDMDLDENNESSSETTDPLFIIDTTPSTSFPNNSNYLAKERKVVYCSDDDFEVDMLRAELIEGMCSSDRAKYDAENMNVPMKNSLKMPLVTGKSPTSPDNVKELGNIKPAVRSITEIETASSPMRLIISLNGESSSDEESDTEQDENPVMATAENPVASIEALISGIRQKSDCNDKSNNVETVPKSVACLSKAQQEEYNALKKILTQKQKPYPLPQEQIKSKFVHSPMDDLRVLEEKLMGVEEVLKSRKEKMTSLSKEVFTKKQMYMKAKLSAQHLKEQYILAEKRRRIKLDSWSKSCKNFESMKKSVSELEGKINKLQDLCSRVGSCIQGKNYCLPSGHSKS